MPPRADARHQAYISALKAEAAATMLQYAVQMATEASGDKEGVNERYWRMLYSCYTPEEEYIEDIPINVLTPAMKKGVYRWLVLRPLFAPDEPMPLPGDPSVVIGEMLFRRRGGEWLKTEERWHGSSSRDTRA
jgi:hypothetical protein